LAASNIIEWVRAAPRAGQSRSRLRKNLMLDSELKVNQFLVGYCRMLIDDIPDGRMVEQPLPDVNHPAWVLGHLAFSADRAKSLLGAEKDLPEAWTQLFGPGSKPTTNRGDYPSKGDLLQAVEQGFERLRQKAAAATPEQLTKPSTNPRTRDVLPTVQDGVAFLLTGHLGVHLGQLSTWRRMIGLARLF
jgi:DinB superfamily